MLDAATGLQRSHYPNKGDLSLCAYCMAFLRFGDGHMLLLSPEEFAALPDDNRKCMERAKATLSRRIRGTGGYVAQIEAMAARARGWRHRNPDKVASVQFNFPERVFVTAAVSDAIESHLISANADGLELIKALSQPDEDEPTAFMLRMALEHSSWNK